MRTIGSIFFLSLALSLSAYGQATNDIVFGNFSSGSGSVANRICLNNGSGSFACTSTGVDAGNTIEAEAADVDGANGPDIIFANRATTQSNRVCLNDGAGAFTCGDVDLATYVTNGIAIADFDGINGLDIAFANRSAENRLCLNNGAASFSCSNISVDTNESSGAATADFDGINGPDLVFSNVDQVNRVCLNNGSAVFSCSDVSSDDSTTTDVRVGDFDGTNGPDLVFANNFQPNHVCLNNGSGSFSCSDVSSDALRNFSVSVGDVDGTNGPDLVFAVFDDPNRLCLNNGSGTFSCGNLTSDDRRTERLKVGSLDGSPGIDVVVANSAQTNQLCTNNGSGVFNCGDVSVATENSVGIAIANFDQVNLPVELVSFTAVSRGSDVVLSWTTASETENAGFFIEEQIYDDWTVVEWVEGSGTVDESREYSYTLRDIEPGTHAFRLKQVDFDGTFEYSGIVEVATELPGGYAVSAAYPNPFLNSTNFSVTVDREQPVRITIHDALGRIVGEIFAGTLVSGQTRNFSLRSDDLPAGLYHYRVEGANFRATSSVMLLN